MCVIQRVNMSDACKVSRCQKYNVALFAEGVFSCRSGGCRRDGGDGEGGGAVSPDEQPGDTPQEQGQWDVS